MSQQAKQFAHEHVKMAWITDDHYIVITNFCEVFPDQPGIYSQNAIKESKSDPPATSSLNPLFIILPQFFMAFTNLNAGMLKAYF